MRPKAFSIFVVCLCSLQALMVEAATGAIHSWVCSRGWRSHKHATSLTPASNSSRPYTVVIMPAMQKVFLEIERGAVGYAWAIGFGFSMALHSIRKSALYS